VKRLIALLAVGAAVAAVLAVPSGAVDTKGPPCADIVFGDGGYTSTPASLDWHFDLAAPSCAFVTYTLKIYDSTGTMLLATHTVSGVKGATSINFSQAFGGPGQPAAQPDGVCLVGTTSIRAHVADWAPDGADLATEGDECVPIVPDSGGGVGFQ
jgi:hypothetical protein